MISPQRVKWGDFSSKDFDVLTCLSFDGDNGEVETYLNREAVVSESYNGARKIGNTYKWSESLSPKITFIKENFGDFTPDENRKMLKWLTGKSTAGFLTIYHDDSEVISYEILGNWTEIQQYKLGNGRIVGYIGTFESITPYAFSPLNTVKNEDISGNTITSFTVDIDTDSQEIVYPRVTIKQNENTYIVELNHTPTDSELLDGTVYHTSKDDKYHWVAYEKQGNGTIQKVYHIGETNNTSNFETTSVVITTKHYDGYETHTSSLTVINNIKGEVIIVDGANKVISSNRINGRVFDKDFVGWNWLPLYQGKNEISIVGNCKVAFDYREVRKTGDYC